MEELERIPNSRLSDHKSAQPIDISDMELLSSSSSAARLVRPSVRVCIIGAGLAGLSAAEALTIRGRENKEVDIQVTVLEAMDRPGGRAFTHTFDYIDSIDYDHRSLAHCLDDVILRSTSLNLVAKVFDTEWSYGQEFPVKADKRGIFTQIGEGLIEAGAQYIHGCEGNPVYERAKEHKLKLNSCDRPQRIFTVKQRNGNRVPKTLLTEVADVYDTILLKTQNGVCREEIKGCGDKSVGAFMKRHFEKYFIRSSGSPSEKAIKANVFRMRVITECCYSACNQLSDLMLQDFGEYKEILGNVTFADGYSQFVDTFLKNINPKSLLYNKPVKQVAWNSGKEDNSNMKPVTVTCEDGDEFEADYVIVTTSLGYLKEHAGTMFSPSLPTSKLDLISRMGFGTAGKIFLEYETPFWAKNWGGVFLVWDSKPSDFMADDFKEEEFYKHLYGIQSIQDNPTLLKVWMFGRSAEYIESLDNDVIAKALTEVLREFLNNSTIPLPDRVHKTQWYHNPYVRGSYSYVATGSCGADIDALAEPVCIPGENGQDQPAICFAGEATHRTFYSTTHGAMLSGQREAERILKDVELRAKPKPTISEDDGRIPKRASIDADDMMEKLSL